MAGHGKSRAQGRNTVHAHDDCAHARCYRCLVGMAVHSMELNMPNNKPMPCYCPTCGKRMKATTPKVVKNGVDWTAPHIQILFLEMSNSDIASKLQISTSRVGTIRQQLFQDEGFDLHSEEGNSFGAGTRSRFWRRRDDIWRFRFNVPFGKEGYGQVK